MISLSKLERDLLANLEEAAEDDIAALLNTVRECHGSAAEIDAFHAALAHLVEEQFVELSTRRDETSRRRVSMKRHETDSVLNETGTLLHWSEIDQIWKLADGPSRFQVVLTNAGVAAARRMLAQDGWPTRLPWDSVEKAQRR